MPRKAMADFVLRESLVELRAGLRSGLVPLIFAGLTAYLLLVLSNAGYMRDMNAADVPRNAPMLVYLLTPGDSLFLFFAWAWVFAQPVVRDRQALLHEVVLAAPVSLPQLLAARWLGAWGVALLLGASQAAGFVLAPLLEAAGAVPAGSMGPTPWAALAWAWLIYIVPLSAGCGALYLLAALRTRSTAGPFAVAALLCVAWMLAVVIIKDGHISPFLGALIDPSGFGEAERQVLDWTPHEKTHAFIAITPGFAANRVLWGLLPLLWLAWVLARARREPLTLGPPGAGMAGHAPKGAAEKGLHGTGGVSIAPPPTSWWRALWCEAGWQTARVLRTRGAWVGGGLLVFMAVVGAFFHIVGHAEGPLVPRPELLGPLLLKFTFLVIVFMVAALAGGLARRDDQGGFAEMVDATPVPLALRFAARCIALAVVCVLCVQLVALASVVTTALVAPHSLGLLWPPAYQALVHLPALLEVAVLVLLVHAVLRHAGLAHAASMLVAFILIVNHEAALVDYPLYEVGIPVHVAVSGATGWAPWLAPLLASDAYKLSLACVLACLAALLVMRGTDARFTVRLRAAWQRLCGPVGVALALGLAGMAATAAWLHVRFVEEGGWKSASQARADDAAWERQWLGTEDENICAPPVDDGSPLARAGAQGGKGAFSVEGGEVRLQVQPGTRSVAGTWRLAGVRVPKGWLHAELPPDFVLHAAAVDGHPVPPSQAHDHLALPLGTCPPQGCEVELRFEVALRGWPVDGAAPWLTPGAMWLRAADVLPRLGFDGDRVLRVPAERTAAGLSEPVRLPVYASAVAAQGVAPAGDWTWKVAIDGAADAATSLVGASGRTRGALDFAAVWSPRLQSTPQQGMEVLHDATRADTARAVAQDVRDMQACVARRLGGEGAQAVDAIVQAPRGMGRTQLSGGVLWLPEQPGWDVADAGVGRAKRRADVARALAARQVADAAALRQGPGGQWLAEGLPGAMGLLCQAEVDGSQAAQPLLARVSADATQALAGSTVPVGGLSQAPFDGWVPRYAPLASLDVVRRLDAAALQQMLAKARTSMSVSEALVHTIGVRRAAWALGVPLSSDLRVGPDGAIGGERWRWAAGGWQPAGRVDAAWTLGAPGGPGPVIHLDAWPGFERSFADNLAGRAK